jgi:predicted porin
MKKSLFALAAIGAVAGTAQAQSSVTVYGIMDLGYIGSNSTTANNAGTATGSTLTKSTQSQFSDSAESTSRLGFKGSEDLGGGLSAFFTVETALTPDTTNAIQTNLTTANRQSFLGLKKAGVGQFAFGTQYTIIHNAVAATDPGMQNNMMGNVIYDKVAGSAVAANSSYLAGGTGTSNAATWQYSGQQNNTSYSVRANNMLTLSSDTFSGFQGNAFVQIDNGNTNSATTGNGTSGYTSGTTNNSAFGLGANYTWQKLLVTANYQQFTNKAAYQISGNSYNSGTPYQGGFGGSSLGGANDKDNQQYYAATYDFGILKAYLQYVNRKTLDINNPSNYVARTAQQIGVRSFVTPTVEAWASAGMGRLTVSNAATGSNSFVYNTTGYGSNVANFGGFQLGSNYWLSKRTNLYAIYGQQHTSNQSWTQNGNPTSYNDNNYAVGVRHTF